MHLIALMFLFVATVAGAAPRDADVLKFTKELDTLHADLEAGKRFKHVDNETLAHMRELETRMHETIAPIAKFSELDETSHAALLADQEELKTVLDRVDGDRPICTAEKKTGTNRRVMVCRSKREEERMRTDASRLLAKPRPCTGVQCGRQ